MRVWFAASTLCCGIIVSVDFPLYHASNEQKQETDSFALLQTDLRGNVMFSRKLLHLFKNRPKDKSIHHFSFHLERLIYTIPFD